jgi:hypothetical protein
MACLTSEVVLIVRRRLMRPWRPACGESAKEVLTRSVKATADVVTNPTVGEP